MRHRERVSATPAEAGRPPILDLHADHHAASVFSDGAGTVDENVRAAERAGLTRLVIVDQVAADTDWLPAHRSVLRRAAARTDLTVCRGLQLAVLDTGGRLELPGDLGGVDYLAVTEHGFPLRAGPATPADLRLLLATGMLTPAQALELLVNASVRALRRAADWAQPVLTRPFGILAEVGIGDELLTDDLLGQLADGCLATGSAVEVSERWRCPSIRVAAALAAAGVPLVAGSGARHADDIGRWAYLRETAAAVQPAAG
jgi:putative hydrolase